MAMFTQLEKLNFFGKVVKPFSTHEGSGLGFSMSDIRRYCVGAEIKEGLAIRGSDVNNAKQQLENWI